MSINSNISISHTTKSFVPGIDKVEHLQGYDAESRICSRTEQLARYFLNNRGIFSKTTILSDSQIKEIARLIETEINIPRGKIYIRKRTTKLPVGLQRIDDYVILTNGDKLGKGTQSDVKRSLLIPLKNVVESPKVVARNTLHLQAKDCPILVAQKK